VRGRGIDFEHRFRTSRWAEDLLIQALGKDHGLLIVRIGLSQIRQDDQIQVEKALKTPDLLVFSRSALSRSEKTQLAQNDLTQLRGCEWERGGRMGFAARKALAALEVEFSPYRAAEMKGRNWRPRTLAEWRKRPLKNANPPIAPNIFVKEEDLGRLVNWEGKYGVPILVVHLFDQEGFAVRLRNIVEFNRRYNRQPAGQTKLQVTTGIFKTMQTYDRVDAQGARERKPVFRLAPCATVKVANVRGVRVSSQLGVSASKKYVSQVLFSGGRLEVMPEFLEMLRTGRKKLG
jgi:hypothetical protein